MRNLLYIFIGGGMGSVFRFLISNYSQKFWNVLHFPLGTFVVNIIGCFLIGIFSAYLLKTDNVLKFLLITGFCGGFTTFSAFAAENESLFQQGHLITLFIYVILMILGGFAAVILGMKLGTVL